MLHLLWYLPLVNDTFYCYMASTAWSFFFFRKLKQEFSSSWGVKISALPGSSAAMKLPLLSTVLLGGPLDLLGPTCCLCYLQENPFPLCSSFFVLLVLRTHPTFFQHYLHIIQFIQGVRLPAITNCLSCFWSSIISYPFLLIASFGWYCASCSFTPIVGDSCNFLFL